MKKYLKSVLCLTIVSIIISMSYSYAALSGYVGVSAITLPISKNWVKGATRDKTVISAQHYHNTGTTSDARLTKESVRAQTKGISGSCNGSTSNIITISQGSSGVFNDAAYCTSFTGDYEIYLSRSSWALTTATHSGIWYLDDTYYR